MKLQKGIVIKDNADVNKRIKTEAFRSSTRKTKAHKHKAYFELVFLSKGSGTHTIDYDTYPIDGPVIFTIRQDQLHFWDITSKPEGFVSIIKKDFISESLDGELKTLLQELSGYNYLPLQEETRITQLFELLSTEENLTAIEGLLKALIAKILEQATEYSSGGNVQKGVFHQFLDLLSQTEKLQNNVAYYAEQLHLTPQGLNNVCQQAVQHKASKVIADHIISEAKRLLIYSTLSIHQIGEQLHFKDPSHFVKYFKRYAESTPKQYRDNSAQGI
ncbi:transcriptional regulator, AraC family [Lishizhenia tianjinensis]|uniref:Transcriptional regulator, AraC family n=1 Tax=Lishizhenia tianjinensis TaxID=477690 RepID=A0A1I7BX07_9FLAO|nr:helix-turn-helix transcriptional regulator [Lishizhenia tianjinensis]SFT91726.1 transcriptional regulator, AraC family [Lishizhenia tianjinensis]